MKKILFVCTGNTCRSPMAERLFNSIAEEQNLGLRAESCGIYTVSGLPASENSRFALEEIGVDLSDFKSIALDDVDLNEYELIVCMTDSHREALLSFGVPSEKLYVLAESRGGISDPYGGNLGRYELCRDEIISSLREFLPALEGNLPVVIRTLNPNDASSVHNLVTASFSTPWSLATIEGMLKSHNAVLIGAFLRSELVGFAALEWILDEGSLTEIVVREDYRRQGIANRLIEELLKVTKEKELSFVTLEVRESNVPAIALYKKYGFQNVGLRKNYYKDPTENAVLMTRK